MFGLLIAGVLLVYSGTIAMLVHYKRKAERDHTTGLYNKCWFESHLTTWMRRANRHYDHTEDFLVLLLDLNKFKNINDTYGHSAGDEILFKVVAIIKRYTGEGYGIRWGGDEFIIMLPRIQNPVVLPLAHIRGTATGVQANRLAVILNREFSKIRLDGTPAIDLNLSASIGGAIFKYGMEVNFQKFFEKIDKSMYEVKSDPKLLHKIIYTDTHVSEV